MASRKSLLIVGCLVIGMSQMAVRAGTLEVTGSAASEGDFGLTVTAEKSCVIDDLVVPAGTVNTDQLACVSIEAGSVQVTSPGSRFVAGSTVELKNGFSVAPGASFATAIEPLVNSPFAFVQDNSPSADGTYNALFHLRANSLNPGFGDEIDLLNGYSANGDLQFRLFVRLAGGNRLGLAAWDDTAGDLREHSTDFALLGGSKLIRIAWSAGAGDGQFQLSIDDAALDGLTDLDNATSAIESVRWGAADGMAPGTTGSVDLDSYLSWRTELRQVGTRLTPFDPATAQNYGKRVAIDGDTVVVGNDIGKNASNVKTGAVYVYVRDGLGWSFQQKITPADGEDSDRFGSAVGIAGDILAVGATGVDDDTSSFNESGAVYIFKRTGTVWALEQKLLPLESRTDGLTPNNMEFGAAVAVDTAIPAEVPGDIAVTTVVVGAPNDQAVVPMCCTTRPGSISLFLRSDIGSWSEKGYFVPDTDLINFAEFGSSVAIDGDGIAVGSWGWRNASTTKVGAAYFFVRGGVQGNWGFMHFFEASDGLADDEFGNSVAIADQGGDYIIAVGAPGADLGQNESGAAYTYHGNTNLWTERKLSPILAAANARFGKVAVGPDLLVVGEPRSDIPRQNAGAAHVYHLGPLMSWEFLGTLEGTTSQPDVPIFGTRVGISGETVIAGAPGEDNGALLQAGAAWVFDLHSFIFADGFEAGNVASWSFAAPTP